MARELPAHHRSSCEAQEAESGAKLVDSTLPGAAAVNQKGKWDYLIGVALACFIGLLNGSLSGDASLCRTGACLGATLPASVLGNSKSSAMLLHSPECCNCFGERKS